MVTVQSWSQRLGGYRLFTNAFALVASVAGSGLLGLIYWDIAAHRTTQASVGRAAGEIAAISLLASIAQLSSGSLFSRFLPSAGDASRRFVAITYFICAFAALFLSVGYDALGFSHRFFVTSSSWNILFVVTTILFTIVGLQDNVLVSLRVSRWVAVENNLLGISKLFLLLLFATFASGQGIVITWTLPLIVGVIVVNWYIFGNRIPNHIRLHTGDGSLPSFRRMLSLSIPQYVTSILAMVNSMIATLIVIARLGAIQNSHYFIVAQVAAAPTLLLWRISSLFVVEFAHNPQAQLRQARHTVIAITGVLFVCLGLGIPLARTILQLIGPAYANQGTTLLRLLLLALPGPAIVAFYAAFAWIDGRLWGLMIREALLLVVFLTLVLAFINHIGINAVGYASLITSGIDLLIFVPLTVRRLRSIPNLTSVAT